MCFSIYYFWCNKLLLTPFLFIYTSHQNTKPLTLPSVCGLASSQRLLSIFWSFLYVWLWSIVVEVLSRPSPFPKCFYLLFCVMCPFAIKHTLTGHTISDSVASSLSHTTITITLPLLSKTSLTNDQYQEQWKWTLVATASFTLGRPHIRRLHDTTNPIAFHKQQPIETIN